MKKTAVLLSLFLISINLSGQSPTDLHLNGGYLKTNLRIDSDIVEFDVFMYPSNLPEVLETSTYTLEEKNDIPFYTMNNDDQIKFIAIFNNEVGVVTVYYPQIAESIILQQFRNNNRNYYRSDRLSHLITQYTDYNISSSSHLREGSKEYTVENLRKSAIDGPWVEGVDGPGIGESINLDFSKTAPDGINAIMLSNGFVSFSNPSLFDWNNRVKRLSILIEDTGETIYFSLEDTPHPQILRFNSNIKNLIIKIEEVYPGIKWNDTCINMITGLRL